MAVIVIAGKTSKVNGHEKPIGSKDKARSIDRDDISNHSSSRRSKKASTKILTKLSNVCGFDILAQVPLNIFNFTQCS